ncbi:hypothetical protein BIY29_05550 [Brenneria alni]|uniref:DNA replication protein n=1 Tax=Brenneria alni TaxID=71656 RepID=A0A421DR88_9GAMM|nr:replication protein P [Brenneria alni]RLM26522.1 hypothetical protein BIY29_05550 [Brenneria alni]
MKSLRSLKKHIDAHNGAALASMSSPVQPAICFEPDDNVRSLFNNLFRQLRVIFPAISAHIKTQAELDELRQQWTRAFAENGINSKLVIDVGLQRARISESPFLPSPGQFVVWCREGATQLAGLPSAEDVMAEFRRYSKNRGQFSSAEEFPWSHPVMYWIVTDMRQAMYQYNHTDGELLKFAERQLSKWGKKILSGQPIPAPKVQIPNLKRPPPTVAEKGLSTPETEAKGKAWLDALRQRNARKNITTT